MLQINIQIHSVPVFPLVIDINKTVEKNRKAAIIAQDNNPTFLLQMTPLISQKLVILLQRLNSKQRKRGDARS